MQTSGIHVIDDPKDYEAAIRGGFQGEVQGLVGRVLRGIAPGDFTTLTNSPASRKIIQLTDSRGLSELLTKRATRDQLLCIGYKPAYIDELKSTNHVFKVVLFSEQGTPARRAYWQEQLAVVGDGWPELKPVLGLTSILTMMRKFPFEYWDMQCRVSTGMGIKDVCVTKDHPLLIAAAPENLSKGSVSGLVVRVFLYKYPQLVELYSGDGFTYNDDGLRQLAEYTMVNCDISAIPGSHVFDLPNVI